MARRCIRNWLADRIQRSPRLHAYLVGAGSIMDFYPSPPPHFFRNDAEALTADMRAVGDSMWAALCRAEVEFGAPDAPGPADHRALPPGVTGYERIAEAATPNANPAAYNHLVRMMPRP
jgi:hypothetical protein